MKFLRCGAVVLLAVWIGSVSAAAQSDPLDLMRELAAEPRIVGTSGYERAMAIVERELAARGATFEREQLTVSRAIPRRSDVLLFDDGVATSAFAGLRERWDPDASPAMPRPIAYDWNPERADVRAPVVDVGRGLDEDYARLASLRVAVEGKVVLVSVPRAPSKRGLFLLSVLQRASKAGAVAVLVTPEVDAAGTDADVNDYVFGRTCWMGDPCAPVEIEPLPIPAVPVRSLEARAIRDRLRVKRVRGADGQGQTIRVGPGPIEARVTVDCPVDSVEASQIFVGTQRPISLGVMQLGLQVGVDEIPWVPLDGAAALVAAIESCGYGATHESRDLFFGPGPCPQIHRSNLVAALAPQLDQGGATDAEESRSDGVLELTRGSRLHAVVQESIDALGGRLDGTLARRLDAAARAIARGQLPSVQRGDAVWLLTEPVPAER